MFVKFKDLKLGSELNEANQFADLNSIDDKQIQDIVKAVFKVLGTKVGRNPSVYEGNIEVNTPLITTAKLNTGAVKMSSYGSIKFVKFEEGKSGRNDRLIVEYQGELYPIAFLVHEGYAVLRFPKSQSLLNDIGKKYGVDVSNADVNPYVKGDALVYLSDRDFKKLKSTVKAGDILGDSLISDVRDADQETRLFRGNGISLTMTTPKNQAGFIFLPESATAGMHEDTPPKGEALKDISRLAKAFKVAIGVNYNSWRGDGIYFFVSHEGFAKIVKQVQQDSRRVAEKFKFDEVVVDGDKVRFTRGTKDLFISKGSLKSDSDFRNTNDYDDLNESCEINPVTGNPLYRTTTPVHMI